MTQRPTAVSPAAAADRAAVLRRVELEVLRRLDGSAAGDNLTRSIGPGSERAGARAYVPGDDARKIDWNLTARTGQTFVRTTEAEREIDTWIVADRSASLDFGTARAEKRDVVLGAAAAFGTLAVRGHNRLGVVLTGTQAPQQYPARTGRPWLMATLAAIYDTPRQPGPPAPDAELAAGVRRLLLAQPRRSQIVVLSDFLDPDTWARPLQALALRHQVVAVHVSDPRELQLPDVGMLAVVDSETGRQRYVQTASSGLRSRYATAAAQRHQEIARRLTACGVEYLDLSTGRDWLTDTLLFATRRRGLRPSTAADAHRRQLTAGSVGGLGVTR